MKPITDINELDLNKSYTYSDYLTWQFKERVELLWGKIKKMTAAPSTQHQRVLGKLHLSIGNVMKGGPCHLFIAPFDVRLPVGKDNGEKNVVQPDLCIVCDESKIDDKGCIGAPDLIIEILSPSTSRRDMKDKLKLYQEAKVPEYWVVNPHDGIIHVFILDNIGKYQNRYPITAEDVLHSETLPGLLIKMEEIFPDILKEPEEPYGSNVRRW